MSTAPLGSEARPLRIAIIGSGPAGFFAAGALLKDKNVHLTIDMMERLPTPFGLIRSGVAPDHQKIKSVTRVFEKINDDPRFRLFCNVNIDSVLSVQDLRQAYDRVVVAIGAESFRSLGIEGEHLVGSSSATEFVGWYNAHPAFQDREFNLVDEDVVVVGVGNVAMDVTRMLVSTVERLQPTDVTLGALSELTNSRVNRVYVLGRRGPAQAAFTPKEIREIATIDDVQVCIRPDEAEVDALSAAWLQTEGTRNNRENATWLADRGAAGVGDESVQVWLRLCNRPVRIEGENGRVTGVVVEKTRIEKLDGRLVAVGTGETEVIRCGLVLRAVGYRGVALPGLPFNDARGRLPNDDGLVMDGSEAVSWAWVVGWAKRGPKGLIGANKADSKRTMQRMVEASQGEQGEVGARSQEAAVAMLERLAPGHLTDEDWRKLDAIEKERGEALGKVRLKFTRVEEMLQALGKG
jgi:ferredoxin--NADP+ reductase